MKLFVTVGILCLAGLTVCQPLVRPAERQQIRRRSGAQQVRPQIDTRSEFIPFVPREPFTDPSARAVKKTPFSGLRQEPSDFRPLPEPQPQAAPLIQPKLRRKVPIEAAPLTQQRPERPSYVRDSVPASANPPERRQTYNEPAAANEPESRDGHDSYDAFGHAKFEQGVQSYATGLDAEKGIPDGRLQFIINGQQGPNSYRFGYDTGYGANRVFRIEEKDSYGVVHGRYGYYDSNGKLRIVNYTAHPEHGFQAEGDFGPK